MLDLYGMSSPNVLKIVLMLEELALPYEFHFIKVWTGEQFTPEFLRLSPNAKAPVILDREGPEGTPYTVFESGAIILYLAEKTGKLLPASGKPRYDALQWLMIQMTGIGPMFGQHVHFSRFAPEPKEYAQSRYRTEALRLVDLIENRLGQAAYLGGSEYGIADIATYPWLRNLQGLGFSADRRPNLARWLSAVAARPATKRFEEWVAGMRETETAARTAATPDDLDRMFGRGRFARTG